ncbi:erythromycin esterase family protein [Methyloceanibacter methanicus]|uniref:erythromycin esterase family protein n=1 Tax=Methyloceanibacter methanicus TaxID=1774968 RepID=UPI001FCD7DA9|nr:erythromycin esterase family protein [Methyloceanibacter methanicus]
MDVAERAGQRFPPAAESRQRDHRRPRPARGFYGLDVYSLATSISAVLNYLDDIDPQTARIARERYGCLAPFRSDPARYGRMALSQGYAQCEKPVADALIDLLKKRLGYLSRDGSAFFNAEQNARIVVAAEQYYRMMYYGSARSWNLRDQHMFETLGRVLEHRGPDSKAVVWAHNSHIGDAEFTEMGQVRGELNIGQLARARFGEDCALIGFGTDRGTVAAASNWDEPMEIKRVRTARADSYEGRARDAGIDAFFLETGPGQKASVREALAEPMLERAIGVIYGRRRSCSRIISRPNSPSSSTRGFGSRRPRPSPRGHKPIRMGLTRRIHLDCRRLAPTRPQDFETISLPSPSNTTLGW